MVVRSELTKRFYKCINPIKVTILYRMFNVYLVELLFPNQKSD